MQFSDKVKVYFKTRSVGFYLTVVAVVAGIVAICAYACGFAPEFPQYFGSAEVWIVSAGVVACIGLAIFPVTEKFAAPLLAACSFAGFLLVALHTYMYLSEVFYSGVDSETLAMLSKSYLTSAILMIVSTIFANVAAWLGQSKVAKDHADETEGTL